MRSKKRIAIWLMLCFFCVMPGYAQIIRSDFDQNGSIDFKDFLLFAQAFGKADALFDLDGNGTVAFGDFLVFVTDFASHNQQSPRWVQLETTSDIPIERFDHTMIIDPIASRLVIFGGKTAESLNDTWIFDLNNRSWRKVQTATEPKARRGHTAIYDAPRHRMVIFGGQQNSDFFNDIWTFDLAKETWQELTVSSNRPVPRYGTSAIVDAQNNRMIISHGFSSAGRFDDTWAFDLTQHTWTNITPSSGPKPLKRCLHDAIFDEANNRMLLFGGCSSGFGPCPQGDLWTFNLANHTWAELQPASETPSARGNPALIYDAANKQMFLFGGATTQATDDTWRCDVTTQTWKSLSIQGKMPLARWSHDAVIDTTSRRLLIFGGTNGAVRFNDLWALSF